MFIKQLKIHNFKCFGENTAPIIFNTPDGTTEGSGLNIFVGENNSGKSTVFECIDFLRNGTKKDLDSIKNKKSCDADFSVEIIFSGRKLADIIDSFLLGSKKGVLERYIYNNEDNAAVEYLKLSRSSSNIYTINFWNKRGSEFESKYHIDNYFKRLFDPNFIWSDTDPNDQIQFGSTTICGNLLKKIIKKFGMTESYKNFSEQFNKTFNHEKSQLKKELNEIETKTGEIFSDQFGDAKISFSFSELEIDSFFGNTEIEVDDGIRTNIKEKGSGMQRSVFFALLQVYAEELIKFPKSHDVEKPFYLFIDEPEISLHPNAQEKLFSSILKLSKTKQIFIATHSPYFLKNPLRKNAGLFIFKKDENNEFKIQSLKDNSWGIFPWSPSLGEINYRAYNSPTVEFHNELYGFLQEKTRNLTTEKIENYFLNQKNIRKGKKWRKVQNGQVQKPSDVTLMTYIRHSIHHPENTCNEDFEMEELKESIDTLIKFIKKELEN